MVLDLFYVQANAITLGKSGEVEFMEYRDSKTMSAALVVYDGRKEEEFDLIVCEDQETNNWKLIRECNGIELPEKGAGYIFFLISEPASKRVSA